MSIDTIIEARMQEPFTRSGLAQTIYNEQPTLGIKKAALIANNAIDKAVKAGQIVFTRDGGSAVFRRTA